MLTDDGLRNTLVTFERHNCKCFCHLLEQRNAYPSQRVGGVDPAWRGNEQQQEGKTDDADEDTPPQELS